ncbi:MAG: hypothetical protein ABI183_24190 [Polyangiaceae bacterium]
MQKNTFFQASLIGLVAMLAACSSSSSSGTTTGGDSGPSTAATPTITISSPTNNGTLTLTNKIGNITFATTNFTLMAPGSCPSNDNDTPPCGHVHVLIDGSACNDSASEAPYNIAANASPAAANFGFCPTADGAHTIVLELHNDDHTPYQVNGQTVSTTISVTTSG